MPALKRKRAIESCYLIPGWCFPRELGVIYDFVSGQHLHVELGSFCGKSLFVAAAAIAEGGKVIAIDPFHFDIGDKTFWLPSEDWPADVWKATRRALNEVRPDVLVEHWDKPSLDAARDFRASIDSLYIDAEHHYAEVLADIEAWYPRVRSGGIVMGHDYWDVDPGVIEAVHEFFGTRDLEFEVVPQTRLWHHRKP